MKKQTVQVQCQFSGEAELCQIFQQSVYLYITNALAKRRGYAG